MKNVKKTVFTASPRDVPEECELVRNICNTLNTDPMVNQFALSFKTVGWEDVFPSPGRPQSIINRLVSECGIFVCIFHVRFGSPAVESLTGTLEEFLLAYDDWKTMQKPHIIFYFKDPRPCNLEDIN